MRIAVVFAPAHEGGVPDYVTALTKGMESMGHTTRIFDAWTENGMLLPSFDYIVVVAEPASFWGGKIPGVVSKILSSTSAIGGKKSAAFLKKTSPIFVNRALQNLMHAMEREGMMLNWEDIILNAPMAEALGKRIGA
jgi:hypothetical protein